MDSAIQGRLGLGVPNEWWPSGGLLKSYEAVGFALTQVPSPPPSVLAGTLDDRAFDGLLAPRPTTAVARSTDAR